MISENDVLNALKTIEDPDLRKDIVTLGFVQNLSIRDNAVSLDIVLTTPACPVKDQIRQQAEAAIASLGAKKIAVTMKARPVQKASGQLLTGVEHVVAVASGKGGVGKSTVATNLALALHALGARVGLLDADIYGPSIPLMMGIHERPKVVDERRLAPIQHHGITLMSIGFLMPDDQALVWRGPMVAQALTQFMRDVEWGELDYLIVDMPPGTGDAQLTMSQAIQLTGSVIVTTPQDVALIDARRGVGMFQKVNVPILGIVENMSYYVCPNCNHRTEIFSNGGGRKAAAEYEVPFLGEIPLDLETRLAGDAGTPIVAAKPDSVNARVFLDIGKKLAQMISVLKYGTAEDKERLMGQKVFFANTRLKVI
jgi:ATP-binding protein involved in chromosome partitioning